MIRSTTGQLILLYERLHSTILLQHGYTPTRHRPFVSHSPAWRPFSQRQCLEETISIRRKRKLFSSGCPRLAPGMNLSWLKVAGVFFVGVPSYGMELYLPIIRDGTSFEIHTVLAYLPSSPLSTFQHNHIYGPTFLPSLQYPGTPSSFTNVAIATPYKHSAVLVSRRGGVLVDPYRA